MQYGAYYGVTWTDFRKRGTAARERQYQNLPNVLNLTRTSTMQLHAQAYIPALAGIVGAACERQSLHPKNRFRHEHVEQVMILSLAKMI